MKYLSLIVSACLAIEGSAFLATGTGEATRDSRTISLMAGKGMGMAATSSKKKVKDNKKGGMGKTKKNGGNKAPAFDVSASMLRLGKRYDELMLASAKQNANEDTQWGSEENPSSTDERITSEYIVAARASSKAGVKDWVPVAQLCLSRPQSEYDNSEEVVNEAVSFYCRELSYVASFGAPVFSTVARNDVQYSVESIESFYKHVYDAVIEGASDEEMTKSEARKMLGLEDKESDKSAIKQAYRKLSFELHPDRFEGTPEESAEAAEKFGKVKLAYETLSSGVRVDGGSWYESLGGRARTSFMGPINLLPLAAAEEQMSRRDAEGALAGLDPDLIQTFIARNLRSA